MTAAKKAAAKDPTRDKTNSSSVAELTREQELKALREMLLIRRFEEKAGQLYGMGVARHGKLPPRRHEELPPPRIAGERVNEARTNH